MTADTHLSRCRFRAELPKLTSGNGRLTVVRRAARCKETLMTLHGCRLEAKSIVYARRGRKNRVVCGKPAGCPGLIGHLLTQPHEHILQGGVWLRHPHGYRLEKETGYYAVLEPERDKYGRRVRKKSTTRRPIENPSLHDLEHSGSVLLAYEDAKRMIKLMTEPKKSARRAVFGHHPVLPTVVRCVVCDHPNRVELNLLEPS